MTSRSAAAVEAIIAKADWIAERGSFVMRAGAVAAWVGAVAATIMAFRRFGAVGWLLGMVSLLPGWMLWSYASSLAGAFDGDKIRGQLGEAAALAKSRVGEVGGALQETRHRLVRGGFKVLRTVRGLRSDLSSFGIDVSGIAKVASPSQLALAGLSLIWGLALWIVALATMLWLLVV